MSTVHPEEIAITCIKYMGYTAALAYCHRIARNQGSLSIAYQKAAEVIQRRRDSQECE